MLKEIGSEFYRSNYDDETIMSVPTWLYKSKNTQLTSSGRGAISLVLEEIESQVISKTVLLPSYLCESIIIPFLHKGYECYFYDITSELKPDLKSIHQYTKKNLGIFLHMSYFGFNTNDNLSETIDLLKNKNTIIVEDITHSLFSKLNHYNKNDFLLASLRKWLGIPSGGLLSSHHDIKIYNKSPQYEFYKLREKALELKSRYIINKNSEYKDKYLELLDLAEETLNLDFNYYAIDKNSLNILNQVDIETLICRRRENFMYLLNHINNKESIIPVFNKLPDNVCPLFFPVYVKKDRDILRKNLINDKIYCPIHWPKPPQLNNKALMHHEEIYDRILSIPCDQRYGTLDMKRIIERIEIFYEQTNDNKR